MSWAVAFVQIMAIIPLFLPNFQVRASGFLDIFHSQHESVEPNVTLSEALMRVQDTIKSIEKQPSCKRRASKQLAQVCATYSGSATDSYSTDESLDNFQKLFAIRMTHCELENANQAVPDPCLPLLTPEASHAELHYLNNCLDALFKRGNNAWTTYTHVKTHGMIMCQALRSEMDKDEQLDFFKALYGSLGDLGKAFSAHKLNMDDLDDQFREIRLYMRNFHEDLHRDNEEIKIAVWQSWSEIQDNLRLTKVDVDSLVESLGNAAENVNKYSEEVSVSFQHTTALSADTSAAWKVEVEKLREALAELQSKHEYNQALLFDAFAQHIYAITNSVELSNNLTLAMANNLDLLNTGIDAPLMKIGQLNSGISDLLDHQQKMHAQLLRMDAQANLTQRSIEATRERLGTWTEAVAVSVSVIDSVISYTSSFVILTVWFISTSLVLSAILYIANWPLVPNILASSGLALTMSVTFVYAKPYNGPVPYYITPLLFLQENKFFIGLVLGGFLEAVFRVLTSRIVRRYPPARSTATSSILPIEYDPASPPVMLSV